MRETRLTKYIGRDIWSVWGGGGRKERQKKKSNCRSVDVSFKFMGTRCSPTLFPSSLSHSQMIPRVFISSWQLVHMHGKKGMSVSTESAWYSDSGKGLSDLLISLSFPGEFVDMILYILISFAWYLLIDIVSMSVLAQIVFLLGVGSILDLLKFEYRRCFRFRWQRSSNLKVRILDL